MIITQAARHPTIPRMTSATWEQGVVRAAGPARTLSAICPCTAGFSRILMDSVGLRQAKATARGPQYAQATGCFRWSWQVCV
jgi:hypothetical protein